jgi:hypothetical protein
VGPGGVFVAESAGGEAAVQDADEPGGEGAQGLVVQVACSAVLVVERPAGVALFEGAERGLVERVVEPPVPDVSSEDGGFLA